MQAQTQRDFYDGTRGVQSTSSLLLQADTYHHLAKYSIDTSERNDFMTLNLLLNVVISCFRNPK